MSIQTKAGSKQAIEVSPPWIEEIGLNVYPQAETNSGVLSY